MQNDQIIHYNIMSTSEKYKIFGYKMIDCFNQNKEQHIKE